MWFSSNRTNRRSVNAHHLGVERLEDRCQPSAGVLDPTFGSGGQVTPAVTPNSVLVQPADGKIVLAGSSGGDMALARYNPNGTLDATFGVGGKEVSTIAGSGVAALYPAEGTTNDGKIVEVGGANTVARFNANGTVDTSFGKKGLVTLPWSGNIGGIVVQPDGKVVVSGIATVSPLTYLEVTRLNTDGSVDTTFGTKGTWQYEVSVAGVQSHWTREGYVALQADGKLLVTVPYDVLNPGFGWWVDRLTTSGAADPTFKITDTFFGTVFNGPDGMAEPAGVAVYPASDPADAGKVLAVGFTISQPSYQPAGTTVLARYNSDGTFDTTFGNSGKAIGANSGSGGIVYGVAIQADGKAIVVGTTMQRYNTDGILDTSFGAGGIVTTRYTTLAIQPDGRIDAASASALARYLASEPEIGSLAASANPVISGSSETLTVSNITDGNPASTIAQVEFYYIDGSGNQQVLGYGTQTSPGIWTLNFTVNLASGNYTVDAQAEDSYGVFGDPIALAFQVM